MWATFNRFEIEMTKAQAESASHSGDCDADVIILLRLPKIKSQLKKISDEDLHAELKDSGAWTEAELNDRQTNEKRIIWIAAGDIREGRK